MKIDCKPRKSFLGVISLGGYYMKFKILLLIICLTLSGCMGQSFTQGFIDGYNGNTGYNSGSQTYCITCDNTGAAVCYACEGRGGDYSEFGYWKCYACNGRGWKKCSLCR